MISTTTGSFSVSSHSLTDRITLLEPYPIIPLKTVAPAKP